MDHAVALVLEAAFLDHPPRGGVRHPAARVDPLDLARAERQVDEGVRGLGGIALAPVGLAEPVAELERRFVVLRFEAGAAEELAGLGDA